MVLEDGDYRFKTAAESKKYLAIRSSGQVFGTRLDDDSDDQKWRIRKRADGFYDITNVGTNSPLSVNPPSKGDIAYTLNVRGTKDVPWDLENYKGYIIFKCSGKYAPHVIDLNSRDRLVLWDRTVQPNQLWIAENLSGGYAPNPQPLPTSTSTQVPKTKPQWVTVQGANIPSTAIQCGWEANGEPLYLARVPNGMGGYGLGTAGRHLAGFCQIAYYDGYNMKTFNTYELLIADPGTYTWVPTPTPDLAAPSFWTDNRTRVEPVLACQSPKRLVLRSCYKGAVFPGYTSGSNIRAAYVENNGDSWPLGSTNCEVLCHANST